MTDLQGLRQQNKQPPYNVPARAKHGVLNVIVLALISGVSLIVILLIALWGSRVSVLNTNQITIENLSQTIAHHTDATLKQVDVALYGVTQTVAAGGTGQNELKRLAKILAQIRTQLPHVQDFFVLNEEGQLVISANPLAPASKRFRETSSFAFHKTNTNPDPHIGPPLRNQITNEWVFTVSRRINNPDGSFAGVVLARISIDYYLNLYRDLAIGKGQTVGLFMADGILLWRLPLKDIDIGASIANGPLYTTHLKVSSKGTGTLISPIDKVQRIVSFVSLADFPLVVYVGRSKQEITSSWRNSAILFSLLVAGMLFLLTVFSYRLVLLIKNQQRTDKNLREIQDRLLKANNALDSLAREDALTGLANRRELEFVLQTEFKRALRTQQCVGVLMLDIDHFKLYNDNYGHPMGDKVLQQVSRIIKDAVSRPNDLAARYGGEEFIVVLPNTELDGCMQIANKIRTGVYNASIANVNAPLGVLTVSVGVHVVIPDELNTVADLIAAADKALYQAKAAGRNRCVAI